MNIRQITFGIPLAALLTLTLAAQTQTRLTGTVTDNTGSIIPGAAITISNINTGVTLTAESNASGNYNFPILAAGQYELVCEFEGFKTYSQSGLVLETGSVRGVNIEMQVGDVTETIEVDAAARRCSKPRARRSANSSSGDTVFNMPVASRRSAFPGALAGQRDLPQRRRRGGAALLLHGRRPLAQSKCGRWTAR